MLLSQQTPSALRNISVLGFPRTSEPQYTKLRSITIANVVNSTGEPQGTVLDPLLFTIYIPRVQQQLPKRISSRLVKLCQLWTCRLVDLR